MANIVAIVGRPNVGKSTLFNRLVGNQQAIVDNVPGITRDRHYDLVEWCGQTFTIIDTGGYLHARNHQMAEQVNEQITIATQEAAHILFVVDCKDGIQPEDTLLADLLRKSNKPILVVANKADNATLTNHASTFYGFGFQQVHPISATHGSGTGDLLDALVAQMHPEPTKAVQSKIPKIAIIGRPNSGKSTLINSLLRTKRNIVDSKPHTTRTPTNSYYRLYNKECILIDTAGIAKKNKIHPHTIEFYALIRSIKAIEQSDVCVLLADAQEGLTTQDTNIMNLVQRKKKGLLLLLNKWDLVDQASYTAEDYKRMVQQKIAHMTHIPILCTSGRYKKNIYKVIQQALEIYANKAKRLPTPVINRIIQKAILRKSPPLAQGKSIKINYAVQLPLASPTFAIFTNHPEALPTNYKRYLEKQIRAYTDFAGLPITLVFKKKS